MSTENKIDTEMREAYELWEAACTKHHLELTPAYDLTALTAIVNEGSGKITKEENVNGVKVDTWKMNEEKANAPEEILKFKGYVDTAHRSNTLPTHLIILTDYGEEADDEVTCFMANLLKAKGVNVTIIHTQNDNQSEFEKQKSLYKERGGKNNFFTIDEITQQQFKGFLGSDPQKNVILQIGPITKLKNGVDISELNGKYKYYIQGIIGATFNSKDVAKKTAQDFINNSIRGVMCDTDKGKGAYKWVMKHVRQAVINAGASKEATDSLCDRVMKIGWRNTVGRAGTTSAKYIAGLVAPGGANYKVVEGIVNKMPYEALLDGTGKVKFPLTEEKIQEAHALATLYFENLKRSTGNPLTLGADGQTTNSVHGSTKDDIIQGYEYILTNLYQYFGVPIKFFLSGESGKWVKYWETPSKKDFEDDKVQYQFEEGILHSAGGGRKLKKKTLKKKFNLKGRKKQKNNSKKRKNNKSNKKTKNNKKQKRKNKKSNKRN